MTNPNAVYRIAFGAALLAAASAGAPSEAQTRWTQREFVLGTWWDPPYDVSRRSLEADVRAFSLARAAGFNLLSGTQGQGGIDHTFEGMRHALTVARRAGLHYLVSDNRFYEGYEKRWTADAASSLQSDYGGLPDTLRAALYGYDITDEPHFDRRHAENVGAWVRHFQRSDPSKLEFFNLAPVYSADARWGGFTSGDEDGIISDAERGQYEAYVALYVDSLRPGAVCFDHYPFFRNGTMRRDYFYNLDVIRRKAAEAPFWASPMVCDHFDYVDPAEEHIRFMYFCPIAYGARGLMAFTYWSPPDRGYRLAMVDRNGRATPKYDIVKRLNMYVRDVIGPVAMATRPTAIYHVSTFPSDQQFVQAGIDASSAVLRSVSDHRILVSVLEGSTARYLLVVNKDLVAIPDVEVVLAGEIPVVYFAPRVVGFDETVSLDYRAVPTRVSRGAAPTSTVRLPQLAGGEGRLIRIR